LRIKTLREKGLTHGLKKAPGSKKRKKDTQTADTETKTADTKTSDEKPTTEHNGNGIKNSSTASLTQKVMKEQDERNKRRKMAENENVKSLFSKGVAGPGMGRSADYMTRGFSIGKK
jgi:hypothetical protein